MTETVSNSADRIIEAVTAKGQFPPVFETNLDQEDIVNVVMHCRELFLQGPSLLRVRAPVKICGDIHGQLYDLLRIFAVVGKPPTTRYLFLGDDVDRGPYDIEVISLLLSLKVKFPNNIFLLRGNHESRDTSELYGFYDNCKRRYTVRLWKTFVSLFDTMPLAAVVEDRIFAVHGGLSPALTFLSDIDAVQRPTPVPDEGLVCDLLWSDPSKNGKGFKPNRDRGASYVFGKDVVENFLADNDLDLICRAHEVVADGYQFMFDRKLITIFSAPNYCDEFDNACGVLSVASDLTCSIHVLGKPKTLRKAVAGVHSRRYKRSPRKR